MILVSQDMLWCKSKRNGSRVICCHPKKFWTGSRISGELNANLNCWNLEACQLTKNSAGSDDDTESCAIPVTGVSNCKRVSTGQITKDSRPPSLCHQCTAAVLSALVWLIAIPHTFSPLPIYSLPKTISESSFHQWEVGQTFVSKCTEYSPDCCVKCWPLYILLPNF